jgi:hypothetical protein
MTRRLTAMPAIVLCTTVACSDGSGPNGIPQGLAGTIGGPNFPGVDFGGAYRRVPQLPFVNPARFPAGAREFTR